MSHGASAAGKLHRENGANLSAESFLDEERHIARAEPSAHGRQTPGQATPVKAVSRRSRARKARALTGVGWSGSALPSVIREIVPIRSPGRQVGLGATTHCADLLTARENLRCCNVRSCQKKCDKALYYLTTDRGAPCAFYPAIKRSVSAPCWSCAIVRQTAVGQKTRTSIERPGFRVDLAQLICRFFIDRRVQLISLSQSRRSAGAAAVAPVARDSHAGRSQADRSQLDVINVPYCDSGHES